jgi:hypothetical protein
MILDLQIFENNKLKKFQNLISLQSEEEGLKSNRVYKACMATTNQSLSSATQQELNIKIQNKMCAKHLSIPLHKKI